MHGKSVIVLAALALFGLNANAQQDFLAQTTTVQPVATTTSADNEMLFGGSEEEMNFETMEEGEFGNEEGEFSNEEGEFMNEENELIFSDLGF